MPEAQGFELTHVLPGLPTNTYDLSWSPDGRLLAAGADGGVVALWQAEGDGPRILQGPSSETALAVFWHPTRPELAAATRRDFVTLWNLDSDTSRSVDVGGLSHAAWEPSGRRLAAVDFEGCIGLWDMERGTRLSFKRVHDSSVYVVGWAPDGTALITGCEDGSVAILDPESLSVRYRLVGHSRYVYDLAVSPGSGYVASGSQDSDVRVWDLHSGRQVAILEGHTGSILSVAFSPGNEILASSAKDGTVRLWRCEDWECVATIPRGGLRWAGGLSFHPHRPVLAAKDSAGHRVNCWGLDYDALSARPMSGNSTRYVNAKVVLVGDTGVGKSGLGLVLSGEEYRATDSTHARSVRVAHSEQVRGGGSSMVTREILLWDLAGQPGYRLVHQLHLNEVTVALVVFDSRSETDPFTGVKHWLRALAQARRTEDQGVTPMKIFLVAGRIDRGGVGVGRQRITTLCEEYGIDAFYETSAKEGLNVAELTDAIRNAIPWDHLPTVSSNTLFDRMRDFLLEEKQDGRLLATMDDLFRAYRAKYRDDSGTTLRANFEVCLGRIESRGLLRRLRFGDLILLQPELLDAYASAIVQTAKDEPDGLGFIPENDVLAGRFTLPAGERVKDTSQEKLLIIATVEELLRHEVALKETTDSGVDIVFPAQFTRERPEAPQVHGHTVTLTFDGALQNVYATLAVRLARSRLFTRLEMWRNAASYRATVGGTCGLSLRELEEGRGELAVFFDDQANPTVRQQFEAYVMEHLQLRSAPGSVSARHIRSCPGCGYVLPEDLIQRKLARGATTATCPDCEAQVIPIGQDTPVPAEQSAVSEMHRNANSYRDSDIAQTVLRGKIETSDFDVFLCYNTRDRESVVALAERLKERGILPWLDVWEIPPGVRWQKVLRKGLKSARSAAVFVGPGGPGPWQDLEVETLLQHYARQHRPIIPVVLPGRRGTPRMPGFLDLWQVIDMREPETDPFERLIWGITGRKPEAI
ncbi:TIR domain-containing protein [Actinoplanes sp. NPDC049681]|uniref:TIR domain-containing protein n=1 Tax=Actinoplanes sp. NPDC049681 TaxID=3363905 RepID=UPI0037B720B0